MSDKIKYEKVCCWCRKVIIKGKEAEHIHFVKLRK